MKFGRTDHRENIDFTLPPDHTVTAKTLKNFKNDDPFKVYVGCAKWNKADLKGFYPRGRLKMSCLTIPDSLIV